MAAGVAGMDALIPFRYESWLTSQFSGPAARLACLPATDRGR